MLCRSGFSALTQKEQSGIEHQLSLASCNCDSLFPFFALSLFNLYCRDVKSSKETTSYFEGLHANNDDVDSKSDGSDNMFRRTYPDEPANRVCVSLHIIHIC